MRTKQLKHHINNTGDSARFLVDSIDKSLLKNFDKHCKGLNDVMYKIRKHYPDSFLLVETQKIDLYIGDRNMGDYKPEGYSRYSVTKNGEFIAMSCIVDTIDIQI